MGRLSCPTCGAGLQPPDSAGSEEVAELTCPGCGSTVRARRREPRTPGAPAPRAAAGPVTEGLGLEARVLALWGLERVYRAGLTGGTLGLLALGGFVPVGRRWLRDELDGWGSVIETLGGVPVRPASTDPDADLGPVIARGDAPRLFHEVDAVSRRLGVRPPQQLRLTYLPCCGATAWGRNRALVLGLPLLDVLSLAELRAVLAHELAHLARGDATRAARAARFVEVLGRTLDAARQPSRSPLRLWARACHRFGKTWLAPVARGQEARADRAAALLAGGSTAASALVKVALVQPLFREALDHYDPTNDELPNLYAFFRAFWFRLPDALLTAMRHRLLSTEAAPPDGPHPALVDRLALVHAYPDRPESAADAEPAVGLLGDLEALEQMLHNRLFALNAVEPSTFHRAGS